MTEPVRSLPAHLAKEDWLQTLQEWEAGRSSPSTIWDAVQSGSRHVAAGLLIRDFRLPAKDAIRSRERAMELRQVALLVFESDVARTERFLRAPSLLLSRSPLEASAESSAGLDEALRLLVPNLSNYAMRFFDMIARSWELTEHEATRLLECEGSQIEHWRYQPVIIPSEALERVTLMITLRRELAVFLQSQEGAGEWLRTPREPPPYNGLTALEFMLREGKYGIRFVRDYLEGQRWAA